MIAANRITLERLRDVCARRGSNNPPAKPGALEFVSRSKRLNGVADAAPQFLGHLKVADQRQRFNASSC